MIHKKFHSLVKNEWERMWSIDDKILKRKHNPLHFRVIELEEKRRAQEIVNFRNCGI